MQTMPDPKQGLGTGVSQAETLRSSSAWKQALPGESCEAAGAEGHGVAQVFSLQHPTFLFFP